MAGKHKYVAQMTTIADPSQSSDEWIYRLANRAACRSISSEEARQAHARLENYTNSHPRWNGRPPGSCLMLFAEEVPQMLEAAGIYSGGRSLSKSEQAELKRNADIVIFDRLEIR